MATGKSNKWFWIIGSLILIGGGIGAYFLLRPKKEEEEEEVFDAQEQIKEQEIKQTPNQSIVKPSELSSEDKIKAFQDWMDKYRPLWINDKGTYKNLRKGTKEEPNRHINGVGYGTFGKNSDIAWKAFGSQYLESLSKKKESEKKDSPNEDDVNKIISYAIAEKAQRADLNKKNAKFIKAWADAIRNKNETGGFIWGNQIYSMKTGQKGLKYNPINVNHWARIGGQIGKLEPFNNSSATTLYKGLDVGKARGYKFSDGNLWLYFPDNGGMYKWGLASAFTKNNPKSSFDGESNMNFEPSSSFDAFEPSL